VRWLALVLVVLEAGRERHHRDRHRRTRAVNSVIVTASGLLFGAGRDNALRGRDTDTGAQVWSSRFGGDFVGSPVMYETALQCSCR
jgi:hypothetical protein